MPDVTVATPVPNPVPVKPGWSTFETTLMTGLGSLLTAIVAAIGTYLSTRPATPPAASQAPPAASSPGASVPHSPAPAPSPSPITPPPNASPALHLTVVIGGKATSAAPGLEDLAAKLGDGLIVQRYDGTILYSGKMPSSAELVEMVKQMRGG